MFLSGFCKDFSGHARVRWTATEEVPVRRNGSLACILIVGFSAGCEVTGPRPGSPSFSSPATPTPTFQAGALTKGPAFPVLFGELISDSVAATDTPCYRSWDSTAPCRWFVVLAPTTGFVTGKLCAVRGGSSMELWSIPGDGEPGTLSVLDGCWRVSVRAPPDEEIAFGVMSYQAPEPFTLQIDLR